MFARKMLVLSGFGMFGMLCVSLMCAHMFWVFYGHIYSDVLDVPVWGHVLHVSVPCTTFWMFCAAH
jgi:hypothetical protein